MNNRFTSGTTRGTLPKDVEETRTIPFILSTYARDRNKTVLNQAAWELANFKQNPVVGYMHSDGSSLTKGPDPDYVIGRGIDTHVEGIGKSAMLVDKLKFDPASINILAEKIFRKFLIGSMRGASVMFLEIGRGKYGQGEESRGQSNETYYTSAQELLEWSIVNIPSNAEAGMRNAKKSVSETCMPALKYLFSELGMRFNRRQIEQMKVSEVLDILNAKDLGINTSDPAKARRIIQDPVARKEMDELIIRQQKALAEKLRESERIEQEEKQREDKLRRIL